MTPRIGSLFAGYGGLDLAVEEVFGGELAWYSEIDKGALKILEHRFPGIANVGSVTEADWSQVEPVDILTGGSPCQDLSHAGRRAGMTEGTRSNLWVAMREAIAQLRPKLVIWENVRGAYSACADSDMGRCPRCVDSSHPGGHAPYLRALGRVLGDLSSLGYDAQWHGLRAADVGAAHGRFRVFVIASLADSVGLEWSGSARAGWAGPADGGLLPTPRATDGTKGGPGQRGSSGDLMLPSAVAMLPTPQARDFKGYGPADASRNDPNLSAITHLLPTPAVNDMGEGKPKASNNEKRQSDAFAHGDTGGNFHRLVAGEAKWGDYAAAIARWESVIGRPAPEPTQTSSKGNPQLSACFVEWLMGLPAGWVTDVPGITRNEALKALGNGVVPQQATEALRVMVARAASLERAS